MSHKNKVADWTDAFTKGAESTLPTDDFTPSNGTTFGLDSFNFDTPDGAGIDDGGRLPSTRGLSGLPDGFVSPMAAQEADPELVDDDGIILGDEDIGLGKEASVVDLKWLDPTQPQDPDRLPDNEATLDSLSQLEEAWGSAEDADIHLVPTRDREVAQYEESIKEHQHSDLPGQKNAGDAEAIKEAAYRAVRRAHFGQSIAKIKADLVDALGHDAVKTRKLVATLESEYGLLGNVFIRASAFPGIRNGQWVKEIKRACRTAHYVITDDATVATKLGMQMVAEVPWKEASSYYRPLLIAAGHKMASGDPREALRKAFLTGPKIATPKASALPVVQPEIATEEEAVAELKAARAAPTVTVKSAEEQAVEQKRKAALVHIARMVKAGSLTQDAARRIASSSAAPHEMLKQASAIAAGSKTAQTYVGAGTVTTDQVRERVPEHKKAGAEEARIIKASKDSGIAAHEFTGLLRWARQQMSEGMLGADLNDLMRSRFAPPLLKAASSMLKEARAKHEGLAGHLYVDASAYATPSGSAGCERNASKHRSSGVKFVLAMPRCGTCVHKNANGVCSQFNKTLTVDVPAKDPAAYQREVIKQANATDAEKTAALFNPAEFDLQAGEFENVETTEHAPVKGLGDVLFGDGLEVGE